MKLVLTIFGIFLCAGCATIQNAPSSMDKEAKAFKPDSTKAILYIFRDNVVNATVAMDILINGRYLGKMRSGHFIRLALNPGQHSITSHASNDRTINVNTQAGKIYFVQQEGTFELFQHGTDLKQVNSAEGKRAVLGCTLVEHLSLAE